MNAIGRFALRPRNVGAVTACVVATAMVVAAVSPVWDPDGWWVAAAGREMLAHHALQTQNVFSYVEPGHAWVMHEWLFGIPYALALERFGPSSFDFIAICAMACSVSLLAAGTVGRARHLVAGLVAMLVAVVFFGGRFLLARPTSVALVFPLGMALVVTARRFGNRALAAAVVLELVWANSHGSFPLGIALLLVGWIEHRREVRRAAAVVASLLATFATPHGASLHRFVWGYFLGSEGIYRSINTHIREFGDIRSAWGATVGPSEAVGLVLVTILALSAARVARHRVRALFCLALIVLALLHARHVELAGLLSCLLLLPHGDELWDRIGGDTGPAHARARIALLLLLPGLLFSPTAFAVEHARRRPSDWIAGGASFLRALAQVPSGADAFVPFAQAGLAIWYGFPRGVRVFFDPRNDCYSVETLAKFWSLEDPSVSPDARRAALDASHTDAAVVQDADPLAAFLAAEKGWRAAAHDGSWNVYLRADPRPL